MAFDNVLLNLQAKKADAQAKSAVAEKGKTDATAASAAVQDPALAKAYMSHSLVATQAKSAMDAADAADAKLADAKAKQVEANNALADAQARANEAQIAADAATAGIPDQSAHDFSANPADNEARRLQAQQAVAKAEAARVEAEKAAEKARDAAADAAAASQRANQASSDAKKVLRDGTQLQNVPPGTLGADTDQFNSDSKAAKDKVDALGNNAADDAAKAAKESTDAAEQAVKDAEALRNDAVAEKAYLDTRANRVNTPIVGPPGQSNNKVSDLGNKAFDSAEEAKAKASEVANKAEDATKTLTEPPGDSPMDKAQKAVDEAKDLKGDLQPVYDDALKAAQKVPYDSDANAAKAKEAIKAAEDAKKAADEAADLAKQADKELQAAKRRADRAQEAVNKKFDDIKRATAQERFKLGAEQNDLRRKLKDANRAKDRLDLKAADKERKLAEAKRALERARLADKLPDASPGTGACESPSPVAKAAEERLKQAQDVYDDWKRRQQKADDNMAPLQARLNEITDLLADNIRLQDSVPAITAAKQQIRNDLMPRAQDMKQSLQALEDEVKAIKEEAAKAKAAAEEAAKAKDEAVDKRIDQLMAEGHGPQRHEGQVTPKDLGERAVYKIDPESHLQIDAETLSDPKFHEIHSADAVASKFTSKETYVLAESNAREQLLAAAPPGSSNESIKKPLSDLGNENKVAEGIKSKYDPATQPKEETSLGTVRKIPTKPPYAYDAATPPPNRAQMDDAAMAADIKANSEKVDFTGGVSNAIYRKDTNGKWYLRTMWTEPAP